MIAALVLVALVGAALALVVGSAARPPALSPTRPGRDTSADGRGVMLDPGLFAPLMPDERQSS